MKRPFSLSAALFTAAALALTSCSAVDQSKISGGTTAFSETRLSDENVIYNNQVALMSADAELPAEPFSSYTFDFSDGSSKYMVTVALSPAGDSFDLTLENSNFGFSDFRIYPPENYTLNIPFSQDTASSVCNVIKNTVDDTPVSDILEFTFYLNNYDDESRPYTVRKYYSARNDELCEISLYDFSDADPTIAPAEGAGSYNIRSAEAAPDAQARKMDYCSDGVLLHTEPTVFMPAPKVSIEKGEDDSWIVTADVYVYEFDPTNMTMTKWLVNSDFETSPLYYGYKAHAVADSIAKYFTTTCLNVSDYEHYVEVPSVTSEISDYFFKVDDPRFGTVEELRAFVRYFFTEKLVSDMFINAPQKYRDIDGELYTIVGDGGTDFTLGSLTITDFSADGSIVTYHTKQEKYSEDGKLTGYIDGGDFSVDLAAGDIFVTQYRFSY